MYTIYGFDSFSKEEYLDFFLKLLLANYTPDIEIVLNKPDPSLFYTLVVEFSMILEGDVNFGPLFITEPSKLLPIFNEALLLAQEKIISLYNSNAGQHSQLSTTSSIRFNYKVKKNCRIRVCDLPICKEITHSSLPRSNQVGLFVEFRGTVIRSGHTRVLEKTKRFECPKCFHHFNVSIDFEQCNQYNIPKKCPNPEYNCPNQYTFKPSDTVGEHCDYQEIKLQEQIHQLGAGSIPGSIIVLLQEDLVDQCQAGDDIIVSGIVIRRWKPIRNDERCDIEIVLLANYVRVMNEQKFAAGMTEEIKRQFEEFWLSHDGSPLSGRNRILGQVCSGVYGLFVVKLALLLILIGGCNIDDQETGAKKRGECHLLLVGEPGTGKSQFLKFAAKVSQRSVLTTGIGTTSAGLTAASVKEPGSGEMVLEAGALVLADGGVCCIDEFSGIKTKDRATIHEAMEQQSLSIAKGGIISRLHTRTSIIAATNAKGKYDTNETLTVNTSIATPLLSRFDIILLLTDNQDEDWDTQVSDFILNQAMVMGGGGSSSNPAEAAPFHDDFWNLEMLQSYIYYVKGCFRPQLTDESRRLIDEYYKKQRANVHKANESRTTVRLLESLIRLSQAHARLMFRNTIEVQDAVIAIFMLESSIETNCIFSNLNAQHSDFPDDPEADYILLEKKIKGSLNLSKLVSNVLPRRINKPKPSNHKTNSNWVNEDDDEDEEYEEQRQEEGEGEYEEYEQEEEYDDYEAQKDQPPQEYEEYEQQEEEYEQPQQQQQQDEEMFDGGLEENQKGGSQLSSNWADDTQYSEKEPTPIPQKPIPQSPPQQQAKAVPRIFTNSQHSTPQPQKKQEQQQETPQKTPSTFRQTTPAPPIHLAQQRESEIDEFDMFVSPTPIKQQKQTTTTTTMHSNKLYSTQDDDLEFLNDDQLMMSNNLKSPQFSFNTPIGLNNKTTTTTTTNNNNSGILNGGSLSGFDDDLDGLDDDDSIFSSQKPKGYSQTSIKSKLNTTEDKMVTEIQKLNTQDANDSSSKILIDEMNEEVDWGGSADEDEIFNNEMPKQQQQPNTNTNTNTNVNTSRNNDDDNIEIDDLEWD